jgi:hypothetical protein
MSGSKLPCNWKYDIHILSGNETRPSMDICNLPGREDKSSPRDNGSVAIQPPDVVALDRENFIET